MFPEELSIEALVLVGRVEVVAVFHAYGRAVAAI